MVKNIMRDPMFLGQRSEDATEADRQIVTDLWILLGQIWIIVLEWRQT